MARRALFLLLSLGVALPVSVLAEELTPEQIASIRRDEQKALDKVNAAHGNKPASELSSSERREMIHEQQEASRKVLDEHRVSVKDYARQTARLGPEGNAQVAQAQKTLEAREKAAQKPAGSGEIPIQRGIDENHPVTLEGEDDNQPNVEQGLPQEEQAVSQDGQAVPPEGQAVAKDDQALPNVEQGLPSDGTSPPAVSAPKAAKPAKGGHKKKK